MSGFSIPWWIRWPVILICIGLGVLMLFAGSDGASAGSSRGTMKGWIALMVIALVFFVFGGQSESEKKGYHF